MNIGAFKELLKQGRERKALGKELEKVSEDLERKAQSLVALKKTQGWKELDKYIISRVELLRDKRELLTPGSEEDVMTNADIKVWKDIKRFVDNWGTEK